jgi:MFS transporter, MFS domain-containing protein family, molybdate-anion transporter
MVLELPDWPAWASRTFLVLVGVTSVVGFAQKRLDASNSNQNADEQPSGERLKEFRAFQRQYLIVYTIVMMADWLQGTNMYTLYQSYNVDISTLFVTGFTSSAIFGTIVGMYVDIWGRKLGCIVYLIIEVVVNVFEHFNNFPLLLAGRVLGGISTSLLFSAFETWMVCEHRKRGFPEGWLADTFGTASFINGISAIIAGICAQLVADQLGEIGPFQAAIALTVLALFFVVLWEENYGSNNDKHSEGNSTASVALKAILNDRKILLTGVVNSLFEGSMYSFVFMWVPTMLGALNGRPLPTGLVFSSFMTCMSLGGLLFSPSLLLGIFSAEQLAVAVFLVGAAALSVPVFSNSLIPVLLSFIVFETCVGTFFPCLGLLRSKVIPDSIQGSVMNIFRVPLNIFVVVGTKLTDIYPTQTVFSIIVCWLLLGAALQVLLVRAMAETANRKSKSA